jgi:hypothetical protein
MEYGGFRKNYNQFRPRRSRSNRIAGRSGVKAGKVLDIKLIGALIVSEDVSLDLAKSTFGKVKLFGMLKAPGEVKKFLQRLNDTGN